mgnify:CR=1 FL=1
MIETSSELRRAAPGKAILAQAASKSTAHAGSDPAPGAEAPAGPPSLRARLHAWWEGYDLAPANSAPASAGDRGDTSGPETSGPPAAGESAAASAAPEWSESRQQLAQMLWGDGFSVPGEPDYVLDLAKPFGLTGENTLLEIGTGLGGGARTIAAKIGAYVEGFDLSPEIAKRATELSVSQNLEKKATIRAFEPASLKLRPHYYNACLVRETLMAIEDKAALLDKIVAALKPNCAIVIADLFLAEPSPGAFAAMALGAEQGDIFPSDAAPIVAKLKELGIEIRVNSDETHAYADSVRRAWAAVGEKLKAKPVSTEESGTLLAETNLWLKRLEAYDAGEIQKRRIVGFKKSAGV